MCSAPCSFPKCGRQHAILLTRSFFIIVPKKNDFSGQPCSYLNIQYFKKTRRNKELKYKRHASPFGMNKCMFPDVEGFNSRQG